MSRQVPTLARDMTGLAISLVVTVLALTGTFPSRVLYLSVTGIVASILSAVLANWARRMVAHDQEWVRANRPDTVRVFPVRAAATAIEGEEDFSSVLLLLGPDGIEVVDTRTGRTAAARWDQIGEINVVLAESRSSLEAIIDVRAIEDRSLQIATSDLTAGQTILDAWPDSIPVPNDVPEPDEAPAKDESPLW